MPFQKGQRVPPIRETRHIDRSASRRIVHVKCEDCPYERKIDSAHHPGIEPTLARDSGTLHVRATGHTLIYTYTSIHRYYRSKE